MTFEPTILVDLTPFLTQTVLHVNKYVHVRVSSMYGKSESRFNMNSLARVRILLKQSTQLNSADWLDSIEVASRNVSSSHCLLFWGGRVGIVLDRSLILLLRSSVVACKLGEHLSHIGLPGL